MLCCDDFNETMSDPCVGFVTGVSSETHRKWCKAHPLLWREGAVTAEGTGQIWFVSLLC